MTGNECQNFQFSCVNSSDCIAVYNLCDGIPQCPDASDEAPERCSLTPSSTEPLVRVTESPIFLEQNLLNDEEADRMRKQLLDSSHATRDSSNFFHYPKASDQSVGMRQAFIHRPYSLMPEEKKVLVSQVPPAPPSVPLLNSQPQENNFYSNYPFFSPVEYFSPGDLLRRSGSVGYNGPQQQPAAPNDYGRESGATAVAAPALLWSVLTDRQKAPADASQIMIAPPASPYHLPTGRGPNDPVITPIRGDEIGFWNEGVSYLDPGVSPRRPLTPMSHFGKQEETTIRTQTPTTTPSTIRPPHPQPTSHSGGKARPQSALVHKASHVVPIAISHLRESDESGQDTNSAVIALSLGICITFMLAGIVAIRMRSIRQRISRRGGRSLAHDADYLINGMYL